MAECVTAAKYNLIPYGSFVASVFMLFVCIWGGGAAIISLHSIPYNRGGMFSVRNELNLHTGLTNVRSATPEAISRRLLTAGAGIRYQTSPCTICGGQRGTETDFLRYFIFLRQDHSTNVPPSSSPYMFLLTECQTGEIENSPETSDLSEIGTGEKKNF